MGDDDFLWIFRTFCFCFFFDAYHQRKKIPGKKEEWRFKTIQDASAKRKKAVIKNVRIKLTRLN